MHVADLLVAQLSQLAQVVGAIEPVQQVGRIPEVTGFLGDLEGSAIPLVK
jgi:hypothetical protein